MTHKARSTAHVLLKTYYHTYATEDGEYVMGVDVSGGVGRDYSTLCVVDVATRQPVYVERSNQVAPHQWAAKVATIGERYNQALVLAESNNHGYALLRELEHLRYPALWTNADGSYWYTSKVTKLDAYDTLREVVESGVIRSLDQSTLQELRSLEVRKMTPEAPVGLHDDLAMACALAYRCLRDAPAMIRRRATLNRIEAHKLALRAQRIRERAVPWETQR